MSASKITEAIQKNSKKIKAVRRVASFLAFSCGKKRLGKYYASVCGVYGLCWMLSSIENTKKEKEKTKVK